VHGRLDGYLVAIVPPTSHGCNADSDHVHLQVLMQNQVYDVAVNVHDNTGGNVSVLALDRPIPLGAWQEGWHAGAQLGYTTLDVQSGQFTSQSPTALTSMLEQELAQANHLAVFATGYGPDGIHDVHYRDGLTSDGAVVINPQASTSRLLLFHFANQSF
jgi:hypothetical protein